MHVRLGFAISAHIPADILLVDEVLAVGDAAFQAKSLAFMESQWKANGRSIVYVAHQLHTVRRICDRVLWIENGTLVMQGPADEVCDAYTDRSMNREITWPAPSERSGLGGIRAARIDLEGEWATGQPALARVHWVGEAQGILDVRLSVARSDGAALTLWSSLQSGLEKPANAGSATLNIPTLALSHGSYTIQIRLFVDGILHDEVRDSAVVHLSEGTWNGREYPTPRPMALQDQVWS
jgi:lipopolysaccharide transport system ATP-binding protein